MLEAHVVGQSVPRVDAYDKATGRTKYVDDLKVEGMLWGKVLLSPVPHARVTAIDVERAGAVPGVMAVVTAENIPGENQIGVVRADQPLLARDKVRHIGDCLALVAGETKEVAERACRLITVDYDELPGVFSPSDALAVEAPQIHAVGNIAEEMRVVKGNVEDGFRDSDIIVENEYRVGHQEHLYLETQGALVIPEPDGSVIVHGSMQCPFYVQRGVAAVLGLSLNKVRVIQSPTGGAFGGKEDVPSEICAFAALLAWRTRRPVKLVLSREEDIRRTSKRHPMTITYKMGASKDGRILAAQVKIVADVGAYVSLSPIVLYRATVHATGPYEIPNVAVESHGVYTNQPPSGAMRGFGTPQVAFAHESMVDELAERVGLDPLELRRRNALKVGSQTATGQTLLESVALVETMDKAEQASSWSEKRSRGGEGMVRRGIGVASAYYGVSLGAKGWPLDAAGAFVQVLRDGSVSVAIGLTEMGQGSMTVMAQMAADGLGISMDRVRVHAVDTALVPDSGPTVASRTTVFGGNATLDAIEKIRRRMATVAAEKFGIGEEAVEFSSGMVRGGGMETSFAILAEECYLKNINMASEGWFVAPPGALDENGQGMAYYTYAFATQVAEVEVNLGTGQVTVLTVFAAHDVGRAINPREVEGQIEGGVVLGVGYALMEHLKMAEGVVLTSDLSTYIIPTSMDAPNIVPLIVEVASPEGPFGAKGIGEPPVIPTAAAIANAVYHATGKRVRELPITPQVLRRSLEER